jgi:hypothetical protein
MQEWKHFSATEMSIDIICKGKGKQSQKKILMKHVVNVGLQR